MKLAISGIFAALFSAAFPCLAGVGSYLFDMGRADSEIRKGYLQVAPNTLYNDRTGYGWLEAPDHAFDTLYRKLPDILLRDGVTARKKLVFKAKLPAGKYFVTAVLGYPGADPMRMRASVNGQILAEGVEAPWFRLAYQTIRKEVYLDKGEAVFRLESHENGGVGLYALEFRPVKAPVIRAFSPGPDTDSSEIDRAIGGLRQRLRKDSGDQAASNQLDILKRLRMAMTFYEQGGWGWAVRHTGMNQIQRMYAVIDLLQPVIADPADPLYFNALYLLARTQYWLVREDTLLLPDSKHPEYFAALVKQFPNHPLLRMYHGEKIEDQIADTAGGPEWAVLQREAMARMLKVIHWWVDKRQAPNGELGGKYADDVEMLRWWLPAILGADDEKARLGYSRLADGIWHSGELVRGYDRKTDDVEHSAELFRDSHTGMFLVRYGDPAYVERAMISMQNFGGVWSGITSRGHRHFKSYYLSATEVWPQAPYGVDVPLNARALLPGLWLSWYNKNPGLVQLLSEWSEAWVSDAAREENGKPAGIIPPAIEFATERIGGYSDRWYDPGLKYSYYRWDHLGHIGELYNHLAGMYGVTGNNRFLDPVRTVAGLMQEGPDPGTDPAPGSLAWVKNTLISGGEDRPSGAHPFGNIFALASRLTRDSAYTALTGTYGSPYNRFLLTGNAGELLGGFEPILNSLRYNFPLMTSEVKFTDRVYVRGSELLTGMYTGHFGRGFEFPSLVATWKNTGTDVSVLVRKGDPVSTLISLFNAGAGRDIELHTWMLEPGVYRLALGTDANDDTLPEKVYHEMQVTIRERVGRIPLTLPAGPTILRMEQVSPVIPPNSPLPDVALGSRDLEKDKNERGEPVLSCRVHNIGNADAHQVKVRLLRSGKIMDEKTIPLIQAPNDLHPKSLIVTFPFPEDPASCTVGLVMDVPEINTGNNFVKVILDSTEKNDPE